MNPPGGPGWGLVALAAAPFCCTGVAWLATAGFAAGVLLTWADWIALGALAFSLPAAILLWRQRSQASHGP